jgi:uncharacterized protein YfdQ (DUF2303 family)
MAGADAQAIIDAATRAAEPAVLDPDQRYGVVIPEDGQLAIIEAAPDEQRDAPRRVKGTTTVYDVDSLKVLWDKYADADTSELYADLKERRVTAVLNADTSGDVAGFRDHRVVLQCELTPSWQAWTAIDGRLMEQKAFAEFLEDHLVDVVKPTGADMLELAQSFEATTSVDFKSALVLASGQRQLRYEETVQAKAGQSGQIDIPAVIELGLQPFEGGLPPYKVSARFRYKLGNGNLQIGIRLERPEDVLRAAFQDTAEAAGQACDQTVLAGGPPPPR